jgi:outer membrane autotransporter protein
MVPGLIEDLLENAIDEPTPNIQVAVEAINQIAVEASTEAEIELVDKLGKALYGIGNSGLSPKETKEALKQLFGESLVNVTSSVSATVVKTQEVILNRLDRIREIQSAGSPPPSAGSGDELNRIWVGGFGIWAKEDASATVSGYDFSGGGVVLGYDREVDSVPGLRFGIAGSYASGRVKNNEARTTVDLSTVGIGVYGSYLLPNNVFFDANVSYASTKSDYSTNLYVGGVKTGTFHINAWQFGLRAGYVFEGDNFQIIPSVGIRYTLLSQGAFADTLDAAALDNTVANAYRAKTDHQVDIPVQIRFNATFGSGSVKITPELRLGYNFAVKKLDNSMNVGFVGSNRTFKINGTRPRGNSFQAGFGLKVSAGGKLEAFVNYDLEVSKRYRSHAASVGLGFTF